MKLNCQQAIIGVLFFSHFFIVSCSTLKSVDFNIPVDTKSKLIRLQEKKTYAINDLEVYASNLFDGARLNGFEKINDSTANVIITPENKPINNSAFYAFETWSNNPKPFYFRFTYPKTYKHRYIPKIKSNNQWRIIDSLDVFKEDSIVTIKLNLTKSPQIIAAQEIQSSTHVKNWCSNLISGKETYVSLESVGKSTLGRNLPVLNIGIGDKKNKDVIVLLTRQHPPEVTGYYAFQSFLKTILNDYDLSREFLKRYHVIAFPIMNPDGVDLGHWRHNAGGVDLNRDWSEYNQPEIKQVATYITKVLKKNKSKLVLGLDFHSTWYDVFYTNETRNDTRLPTFISQWFKGLEQEIPNYKVNEKSSNSTKPVSKGWFLYGHNAVGITYEIGDATPKKDIKIIGSTSAEEMMKILLIKQSNIN